MCYRIQIWFNLRFIIFVISDIMSALPLNAILENYFYINGQNGVCNVLKLKITKNIPGQKIGFISFSILIFPISPPCFEN